MNTPAPVPGSVAAGRDRYRAKHPAPKTATTGAALNDPAVRADLSAAADRGDRDAAARLAAWYAQTGGDA